MYNAVSFDRCRRGNGSIDRIRTSIHRYHLFAHQKAGGVGIGIFFRTAVISGRPVNRHALAVGRGERRRPRGIGAGQFHAGASRTSGQVRKDRAWSRRTLVAIRVLKRLPRDPSHFVVG